MDIERLLFANRALKKKLEGRYLEVVADQTDLLATKNWVNRIAASPSVAFGKE